AGGTAVGNVSKGFVQNYLALKQIAHAPVGQVLQRVGAHGQIRGQQQPVPIGYLFVNQLAHVHPHLLVWPQLLLQVVALCSAVVVNRELGLHGDAAAIAGGDDRVVRAVHLPFTALPVEGELIVEWSLRAVAQRAVIAGGGGHDVVGTAGQSQLHRSPVPFSRDDG